MQSWIDDIEELLIEKLKPSKLIIEDQTTLHINHPGHSKEKKHLKIQIHSFLFKDKTKLEQHKMVMDLLKPHFKKNIHSVTLETKPDEL